MFRINCSRENRNVLGNFMYTVCVINNWEYILNRLLIPKSRTDFLEGGIVGKIQRRCLTFEPSNI